jgi:hypothetical protein
VLQPFFPATSSSLDIYDAFAGIAQHGIGGKNPRRLPRKDST